MEEQDRPEGLEMEQEIESREEEEMTQQSVQGNQGLSTQVMGHLTIRELEMLPRQEEIARLEQIPVGGTTTINDEVIGAIAGVAAREIDGVAEVGSGSIARTLVERLGGAERRARGVAVEAGRREAIVDMSVRVTYGHSIPHVVVAVRRNVAHRILTLCGLVCKEINVRVFGLEFPTGRPSRVE